MGAAFVLAAGASQASEVQWGYIGKGGPEHWGKLDPAFAICEQGKNQSPVNLTGFVEAELEPITFSYTGLVTEVVNSGRTIEANYTAGSTIQVAGKTFELKQFHFHSPGEHTLNGDSLPLEGYFVHEAQDGSVAVIAVMYTLGEENQGIARLWKQMPNKSGQKAAMASQVRAEDLMPEERDYYRYNGSLTIPPCLEGVIWMVMKQTVSVSREQVDEFGKIMHHSNSRPVQPLNARVILQ